MVRRLADAEPYLIFTKDHLSNLCPKISDPRVCFYYPGIRVSCIKLVAKHVGYSYRAESCCIASRDATLSHDLQLRCESSPFNLQAADHLRHRSRGYILLTLHNLDAANEAKPSQWIGGVLRPFRILRSSTCFQDVGLSIGIAYPDWFVTTRSTPSRLSPQNDMELRMTFRTMEEACDYAELCVYGCLLARSPNTIPMRQRLTFDTIYGVWLDAHPWIHLLFLHAQYATNAATTYIENATARLVESLEVKLPTVPPDQVAVSAA